VPAGVVWGAAAALGVMALAVVVAGLVMYLAWSHEQEHAAQQDTVRQSLADVGRPQRPPGHSLAGSGQGASLVGRSTPAQKLAPRRRALLRWASP